MSISDLTTLPLRAGAALRAKRVFHPAGVLCGGSLLRVAPEGDGLPLVSTDVVGRISKGAGTPGGLPDFAGLAWRVPRDADGERQWDVLTVSATARVVLTPVRSWTSTPYSTLMPLAYRGASFWIRARLQTTLGDGLSVASARERVRTGAVEFVVEQAQSTGPFTPLATLTFDRELCGDEPQCDQPFDPTLHTGTAVRLQPGWLTSLRRSAYRNSREGRGAQ